MYFECVYVQCYSSKTKREKQVKITELIFQYYNLEVLLIFNLKFLIWLLLGG